MSNKPPFPLDEWVEEEVEVPVVKPEYDPEKNRVRFRQTTEKATQKTYYSSAKSRRIVCKHGSHQFLPLNPKKYLFKCENCDYHYKTFPITHKYDPKTKALTHRKTGVRV